MTDRKWKVRGRDSFSRTISWDDFEALKRGEAVPVGSVSGQWSKPLRLAADKEADRRAAEAARSRQPRSDGLEGLMALTNDPVLIEIFKRYHDMKVDKPNSVVRDLWLIKQMYDAGYALTDQGTGIRLPLGSGFRRGVYRVFMEVVYARPLKKASQFLSRRRLAVPLFAKTVVLNVHHANDVKSAFLPVFSET